MLLCQVVGGENCFLERPEDILTTKGTDYFRE